MMRVRAKGVGRRASRLAVVSGLALGLGLGLPPGRPASGQGGTPQGGQAVSELDARIGRLLNHVESAEAKRKRFEAEASGLAKRRKAARERLHERVRALYRITRSGMLPLAGGFPALLGHVGRVERLERRVSSDLEALRSIARRKDTLTAKAGNLAGRIRKAKRELESLRERKRRRSASRSDAAFDQALTRSRFEPGDGWRPMEGGGFRVRDGSADRGFESRRGELAMPVSGTFEAREATREGARGMEFVVQAGATARAVAEGRIAFADRYDAYGRLIIVDHGDDYYTLYGGLGRIEAQLGDYVGRGAGLGTVGAEADPPSLFFEVRHGTRSVDPKPWLGLP